ncbi:iron donor protein CyaY [Catenovulum sediminis]|uniref:Iron-sulfur cluster assembly protein CyaY n=1 Tax=Catenovulum sediminis TaxID=1740262 RepID=A0ABV1RHW8_9ALTE|nr:iron donor protein CyaY [Catenovulum sediminis]
MSELTETQYHHLVDDILLEIEQTLEQIEEQIDIDYENAGGKLDIEFADGSKIIINKQEPLLQLWVATKFNGYHFNYQDGKWIDERFGDEFWHFMNDAVSKQAGEEVIFRR